MTDKFIRIRDLPTKDVIEAEDFMLLENGTSGTYNIHPDKFLNKLDADDILTGNLITNNANTLSMQNCVKLECAQDVAPSVSASGTLYFNTIDKKIYTSDGTAWGTPTDPKLDLAYFNKRYNQMMFWDGTDMILGDFNNSKNLGNSVYGNVASDNVFCANSGYVNASNAPELVSKRTQAFSEPSAYTITGSWTVNGDTGLTNTVSSSGSYITCPAVAIDYTTSPTIEVQVAYPYRYWTDGTYSNTTLLQLSNSDNSEVLLSFEAYTDYWTSNYNYRQCRATIRGYSAGRVEVSRDSSNEGFRMRAVYSGGAWSTYGSTYSNPTLSYLGAAIVADCNRSWASTSFIPKFYSSGVGIQYDLFNSYIKVNGQYAWRYLKRDFVTFKVDNGTTYKYLKATDYLGSTAIYSAVSEIKIIDSFTDGTYNIFLKPDGTAIATKNSVCVQTTIPANPVSGDYWLNVVRSPYELLIYNGTSWVSTTSIIPIGSVIITSNKITNVSTIPYNKNYFS